MRSTSAMAPRARFVSGSRASTRPTSRANSSTGSRFGSVMASSLALPARFLRRFLRYFGQQLLAAGEHALLDRLLVGPQRKGSLAQRQPFDGHQDESRASFRRQRFEQSESAAELLAQRRLFERRRVCRDKVVHG